MLGVGVVLLGSIATASWLTFVRAPSTSDSMGPMNSMSNMNMVSGTMTSSSCDLVSTTQLDAILGTVVQAPRSLSTKNQTVCVYGVGTKSNAVTIRYSMKVSNAQFDKASATLSSNGRLIHHVCGIGDSAYYGTVGEQGSTMTALSVRKGTNEMLIIAPISVNKAQRIAKATVTAL